jgi:hypothetical protein
MTIQINNYIELLEFIKRENINPIQATEIVCKALKVIVLFEMTKEELIKATEYHINTFCQNTFSERPLFLHQKENDFCINELYNTE